MLRDTHAPAFLLPQLLLCGLLGPRDEMLTGLRVLSNVLPLTYAYDALSRVARGGGMDGRLALDLGVLVGATLLALVLGAATLKRQTA